MTARYVGFTVILTDDIREDDAAPLIDAIRMMRGVRDVRPINSDVVGRSVESMRVRFEVAQQLAELGERLIRGDDKVET